MRRRAAWLTALVDRVSIEATERGVSRLTLGPGAAPVSPRASRHAARARTELAEYLSGRRSVFTVPVDLSGLPPFQARVLAHARRIPFGEVVSYADLARRIGRPRAARAVGNALAANPVPLIVPCHRIIRGDGTWRRYALGDALKARLLALERTAPPAVRRSARAGRARMRAVKGFATLALASTLGLAGPGPARAQLPIFDAHIHYSRPDWTVYPPERILALLRDAGVRRALVSSTPDDGTLQLYEKAPTVVVPFLRPYRTREDMGGWPRDAAVQRYVEERLKRGVYRGIGEFHLSLGDADAPVVRRFAELSVQHKLVLQAHVDDVTVEKLLTLYPEARILWAHAGMSASADVVGRLLDRFPRLWVELALRSDVAPGGTLDPGWRAVFVRHADRFMVGTDTWVTSRWETLVDGMRAVQGWLRQLPPDVAERIAFRNADRLFPAP